MSRGFVYVLSNSAMPGLVKIGHTTRTVQERVKELRSTGVPRDFNIELAFEVDNAPLLERALHRQFKRDRDRRNREFFRLSPDQCARAALKAMKLHNQPYHNAIGKLVKEIPAAAAKVAAEVPTKQMKQEARKEKAWLQNYQPYKPQPREDIPNYSPTKVTGFDQAMLFATMLIVAAIAWHSIRSEHYFGF